MRQRGGGRRSARSHHCDICRSTNTGALLRLRYTFGSLVQNYSHQDASVSWGQPGLFRTPLRGLSGGAVAAGCRTLEAGLRSGAVEVSVNAGGVSRTFDLHVQDALADGPATIVIGADGHIADPTYGEPSGGWPQQDALC